MAKVGNELNLVPPILDRLLDEEPDVKQEPLTNRFDVRQLKRAVARDLEALLNTRRETLDDLPSEFNELSRSLLVYGLPDFTSCSLVSETDCNRVRRSLERAIACFEPRLERVRVTLAPPRNNDRGLHFHIEALLQVEPAPEPVSFDAVLRLSTQEYVVQGQN